MKKSLPKLVAVMALATVSVLRAEDITGVQPASLDQPRIYMEIRRTPNGPPLAVRVEKEQTAAVEAFLDTGASGIVLSDSTTKALKVRAERSANGQPVKYQDVGVGGTEDFGVSEPLWPSFAPYSSNTDGDNEGAYSKPPPQALRAQLKPAGGLLEQFMGGLDIAGMPAMRGKVMVMDCRPVAQMDKIKTSLVAPGDRTIPKVTRTVALTYVSFARFTRVTPPGAQGPTLAPNPMIGPDPLQPGAAGGKPASVSYKGKQVGLTMLLDTGAACSMISTAKAAELGVRYAEDGTTLVGVPAKEQFSLDVGGIGGTKKSTGFYLDVLALPMKEGEPVVYKKAPVLVSDVTVTDARTGKPFTLDGVFGMNFMVASANVTGGALPDIDKIAGGPFQFVVIDHAHGTLGFK